MSRKRMIMTELQLERHHSLTVGYMSCLLRSIQLGVKSDIILTLWHDYLRNSTSSLVNAGMSESDGDLRSTIVSCDFLEGIAQEVFPKEVELLMGWIGDDNERIAYVEKRNQEANAMRSDCNIDLDETFEA